MVKFTITPWKAQADLLQVRKQLYIQENDGADSRRHAVDRIMAWKLRGNLPHAVESTALLVDAVLHHDITGASMFSVRAVYSAAFSRFVTGFCDIGRHKERTLEPSSMLDIAKQIGMPSELVALRHEATHEELPSLQRLVAASQQALDWLWKVYWSQLEEPDTPKVAAVDVPALKYAAVTVLRDYRRSRRDALRGKTQNSPEQPREAGSVSDEVVRIFGDYPAGMSDLASVLMEERLLIPSKRKLGSSMDGAYLIWDDFLRDVSAQSHGFLAVLVERLLEAVTKFPTIRPEQDSEKEAYATWLLHLVETESFHDGNLEKIMVETLKTCCLYPGLWTQRIGQNLLERDNGSLREDWQDLFKASLLRDSNMDGVARQTNVTTMQDGEIQRQEVPSDELALPLEVGDDGGEEASWTRGILPPSGPIGEVP